MSRIIAVAMLLIAIAMIKNIPRIFFFNGDLLNLL